MPGQWAEMDEMEDLTFRQPPQPAPDRGECRRKAKPVRRKIVSDSSRSKNNFWWFEYMRDIFLCAVSTPSAVKGLRGYVLLQFKALSRKNGGFGADRLTKSRGAGCQEARGRA